MSGNKREILWKTKSLIAFGVIIVEYAGLHLKMYTVNCLLILPVIVTDKRSCFIISQDYPSLAQLHDRLQQSNIIPIFAVVKDVSSLYQVFIKSFVS